MELSNEVSFLFEGEEEIDFTIGAVSKLPEVTEEQLNKKVIGVQLSHAFISEQNLGLEVLLKDFGSGPNGVIHKVSDNFKLSEEGDIYILRFSKINPSNYMLEKTVEVGVCGYWDYGNLIICATKKYKNILENVVRLIKSKKVRFAFRTVFGGRNLMILKI